MVSKKRLLAIASIPFPGLSCAILGYAIVGWSLFSLTTFSIFCFAYFRIANNPNHMGFYFIFFHLILLLNIIFGLLVKSKSKSKSKSNKVKSHRLFFTNIIAILLILVSFNLTSSFGYKLGLTTSHSNSPNIQPGDKILMDLWVDAEYLSKGDIIVFNFQNKLIRKRIHAFEGDEVTDCGLLIFVNGISHKFNKKWDVDLLSNFSNECLDAESFIVPSGYVYVLGDNNRISNDSRNFGPIPIDTIFAKALYILSAVNKSEDRKFKPLSTPFNVKRISYK